MAPLSQCVTTELVLHRVQNQALRSQEREKTEQNKAYFLFLGCSELHSSTWQTAFLIS